jgi:hypothetical protein
MATRQAELLSSWDVKSLVADLRQSLLGGFLLLGLVAAGCKEESDDGGIDVAVDVSLDDAASTDDGDAGTAPDVDEVDADGGDADVPVTWTPEEFCHRWSVAIDAYHLNCCTAEEQALFYPTPGPEAVYRREAGCDNNIDIVLASGLGHIDEAAAAACIETLNAVAESCPNYGAYPLLFVSGSPWEWDCPGVVVGPRLAGQPCETLGDCAAGLLCDWTGASPVCAPRTGLGGACTSSYPHGCSAGLVCVDGVCAERGDEGAACVWDYDCRNGLRCPIELGTCVPLLPSGAACRVSGFPSCLGRCVGPEGDDGVCIDFCDGETHPPLGPECCTDLMDDDADGLTDCEDYDCRADPACAPCRPGLEICWDGCDNDADCRIDGADPDCVARPGECGWVHCPAGPELCGNGCDDDRDRLVDCADPDCAADSACAHCPGTPEGEGYGNCLNGFDDDCDGQTDMGCDADCMMPDGSPEDCRNGVDDDWDMRTDCDDADCLCDRACVGIMPEDCDDGLDNDADGLVDAEDWDCPVAC